MSLSRSPSLSVSLVRAEEKRFALASCLSHQKKLRSWPDSAPPLGPLGTGSIKSCCGERHQGGPGRWPREWDRNHPAVCVRGHWHPPGRGLNHSYRVSFPPENCSPVAPCFPIRAQPVLSSLCLHPTAAQFPSGHLPSCWGLAGQHAGARGRPPPPSPPSASPLGFPQLPSSHHPAPAPAWQPVRDTGFCPLHPGTLRERENSWPVSGGGRPLVFTSQWLVFSTFPSQLLRNKGPPTPVCWAGPSEGTRQQLFIESSSAGQALH